MFMSVLKKQLEGGWGGGRSASPQMHWMSLHLLAARGGNLNGFLRSVFRVWQQEEATLKKKLEGGWRCIGCSCISWPRDKATLMFLCSVFRVWLQEEPGSALGVVWLGVLVSLCVDSWCSCWSWKEFGCERRRWGLLLFVCLFVCYYYFY